MTPIRRRDSSGISSGVSVKPCDCMHDVAVRVRPCPTVKFGLEFIHRLWAGSCPLFASRGTEDNTTSVYIGHTQTPRAVKHGTAPGTDCGQTGRHDIPSARSIDFPARGVSVSLSVDAPLGRNHEA